MTEDSPNLVRILDNCGGFNLSAALRVNSAFEEYPFNQQFDHPASEYFNHRLEAGKRDIEKRSLAVESAF